MHQHATLEDTVYFYFGANDTSGSGGDGASPLADVRLAGAAASAIPTLSPTPILLTHANFPAGCYEIAVAATAANGFAAGNTYGVFATLTIDSQNPTGFVGTVSLEPIVSNIVEISDDATAASNLELDYDGTGFAKANSTIGTATAVTNEVTADMVKVSGDATAADNLELQYDTTGLTGDTFPATQAQVSTLAVAGAASNTPAAEDNTGGAIKGVTFVGVQTGTFTNTKALDAIYHVIDDTTNAIDVVYGFDVGGDGVPIDITWTGYLAANGDSIQVFGYDFIAVGWVQIGTIVGKNQATNEVDIFTLFTSMVGTTGADTGKVFIRFEESAQSAALSLNTDQIFVSFASVPAGIAYEGGAVWLDTVGGVAGTTVGSNGTLTNPVDSIADARTIADAINLRIFHTLPASSFTLAQEFDGYEFKGAGYTVALGGQSLSGASFDNAKITGNDDGSNAVETHYTACDMMGNSLGKHMLHGCAIEGDMVFTEATDTFWDQCFSAVAGTATPSVDFEAAAETKNFSNRHYSGGLEFKNFGNTGTHTASIEGDGQIVLNVSCAGGTLAIRGNFTVTDNASGAVTLSDDARYDVAQINAEVDTGISDAALATAANLATVDGNVDGIKTKTDSLTFTVAGEVDSNIQSVNDVTVTGTGASGDEWGP